MKCIYCGSENLKVQSTLSSNQTVPANTLVGQKNADGMIEVVTKPFELSVTRRKMKCVNCGKNFMSVEHFERSTSPGVQQYIISNLTFINDNTQALQTELTQEQKDHINALLEEL